MRSYPFEVRYARVSPILIKCQQTPSSTLLSSPRATRSSPLWSQTLFHRVATLPFFILRSLYNHLRSSFSSLQNKDSLINKLSVWNRFFCNWTAPSFIVFPGNHDLKFSITAPRTGCSPLRASLLWRKCQRSLLVLLHSTSFNYCLCCRFPNLHPI